MRRSGLPFGHFFPAAHSKFSMKARGLWRFEGFQHERGMKATSATGIGEDNQ